MSELKLCGHLVYYSLCFSVGLRQFVIKYIFIQQSFKSLQLKLIQYSFLNISLPFFNVYGDSLVPYITRALYWLDHICEEPVYSKCYKMTRRFCSYINSPKMFPFVFWTRNITGAGAPSYRPRSPVKLTSNSAPRSIPSVLRNVPFIKDFLYQDSPRLVCDPSTTGLKLNLSASQRESQPRVMMIKEKKIIWQWYHSFLNYFRF